jgi:hypothetical protein
MRTQELFSKQNFLSKDSKWELAIYISLNIQIISVLFWVAWYKNNSVLQRTIANDNSF